jgi:fructose-1,6-bisphosphatase II
MLCQMWPKDDEERASLKAAGVTDKDLAKVWCCDDLAKGNRILFAATGVSDSTLLKGVRVESNQVITSSLLMRAQFGTIRYIQANHNLDLKRYRLRSDNKDHRI